MVSDAELAQRLNAILEKADHSTTTTTTIRQRLEKELGVDLSSKKAFIRQHIDSYLEQQQQQQQNSEGGGVETEEGVEEEQEGSEVDEAEVDDNVEKGEEQGEEEQGTEEEEEGKPAAREREPEPESKRMKAKIDRAIKNSLPKEKKKRAGGAGGLNKVCGLSPELQKITGEKELPRTQVVKQLWEYIKEYNLQDPENRKKIICDDALRGLFGTDSTDMFKMNKLLSKHIWPLEGKKTETHQDGDVVEPKPKKAKKEPSSGKGRNSGFLSPRPISERLSKFFGKGETEVPRADAVKRTWDYIKENGLQDPKDKRTILCDEKLQELFGCQSFVGFEMTTLLEEHFLKA